MNPKQPAEVQKGSMYVRIKHSHPNHVHVTVAKVVREGNSVRHHHVASIGKVKHSGRHPDGRYKFALGALEMLWQWMLIGSRAPAPVVVVRLAFRVDLEPYSIVSCRQCSPNAPFARLEMLTAERP